MFMFFIRCKWLLCISNGNSSQAGTLRMPLCLTTWHVNCTYHLPGGVIHHHWHNLISDILSPQPECVYSQNWLKFPPKIGHSAANLGVRWFRSARWLCCRFAFIGGKKRAGHAHRDVFFSRLVKDIIYCSNENKTGGLDTFHHRWTLFFKKRFTNS